MIVATGAAVVALINGGFLLVSQRNQHKTNSKLTGQVGIIKTEVKNSHSTNLRDDLDKNYRLLERIAVRVDDLANDVREVRKGKDRLFELDRTKDHRLTALERRLEQTQPNRRSTHK